ncbi:MAG: peptide-methionine (R)-S-oxide reductase MsrB [Alphaproteobacteria bacterium]|nr:peptide-methionine (R)-S-oxide reductase MsrB [Alphaproteobacteria bacterium]
MPAKITRTEAEWRAQLSDMAFKVARRGATEKPFSHDNFPKSTGLFSCICCDAPLFDADTKFDSGTGWPSFYAPSQDDNVGEKPDNGWFTKRTEVHCKECEAHLGHVFADGPQPTGLRYCINGVTLAFKPSG